MKYDNDRSPFEVLTFLIQLHSVIHSELMTESPRIYPVTSTHRSVSFRHSTVRVDEGKLVFWCQTDNGRNEYNIKIEVIQNMSRREIRNITKITSEYQIQIM